MLEVEVVDMIMEELTEFLETYIVMTSLTHNSFELLIEDQKSLKFINYTGYTNYDGTPQYEISHRIEKAGRTKMYFSFKFHKDESNFAMQLVRLLEGYVDYKFSNSNKYSCSFILDVNSKQNRIDLFNRLNLKFEE